MLIHRERLLVDRSFGLTGALLVLCLLGLVTACARPDEQVMPGYGEADYVRVTATASGTISALYLKRGETAAAGAPAFVLEQANEEAMRQEAVANAERATAQLRNLQQGKRADEVAVVQAQFDQAQAALVLAAADLHRKQQLVADNFISAAGLDQARAELQRNRAHAQELQAQLRVAMTGARSEEIAAAEKQLEAARAQLAQVNWRLDQRTQRTPVAGDVVDVLYRQGEWVVAGSPVVTLLPPDNRKARFFVPQEKLGALKLGQTVTINCDGCGAAISGTISFIAPEAEYTAPIIYSKENRARLVFMVEARPEPSAAVRLHPGQPLQVRLQTKS
jgi:HlyD family secretion protein